MTYTSRNDHSPNTFVKRVGVRSRVAQFTGESVRGRSTEFAIHRNSPFSGELFTMANWFANELRIRTDESVRSSFMFRRIHATLVRSSRLLLLNNWIKMVFIQGNREFLVKVLMVSLLHHPNFVNLIGYCTDGDQRLLVYEFMPLGSLENQPEEMKKAMEKQRKATEEKRKATESSSC